MTALRLRLLVKGFVKMRLGIRDFSIVGTEDFGDHWRVKVKYRRDSEHSSHEFAINHQGRLLWDRGR